MRSSAGLRHSKRPAAATLLRPLVVALATTSIALGVSGCATVKGAAANAADRATGREVAERVDRGVSAAADGAEDVLLGDGSGPEDESRTSGNADATAPTPEEPSESAPLVASAGFDFEPGERVLYVSDFPSDNLGDFPRSLDWKRGTLEVVDLEIGRFLRASSSNAAFSIPLGETLPAQFTIELEIFNPGAPYGLIMTTGDLPRSRNGFRGEPHIQWAAPAFQGHALIGAEGDRLVTQNATIDGARGYESRPVTARVMVDDQHMKLYWGDRRIANVPQVDLPRGEAIHLVLEADAAQPIYIGNIRIAAGGRDLYAVLERDGRFTAQGIEFDTGSDRIRPSSHETLDQIGLMLQQHADLAVVIEGHTDSNGSEAANLDLSTRRAASVRSYLIENYGVQPSRLTSAGFGEARPVGSNETPEGRQQNRRVDIVRAPVPTFMETPK